MSEACVLVVGDRITDQFLRHHGNGDVRGFDGRFVFAASKRRGRIFDMAGGVQIIPLLAQVSEVYH